PILAITQVTKCTELPLPSSTSPSAAWDFFLNELRDVLVSKADLQADPHNKMVVHLMKSGKGRA
ncbi:hypothetical protein SK128_016142, partial [Halocaridina rubra]